MSWHHDQRDDKSTSIPMRCETCKHAEESEQKLDEQELKHKAHLVELRSKFKLIFMAMQIFEGTIDTLLDELFGKEKN